MDTSVEKLHRAIISAIRQMRGADFSGPVTVSQIYQELVPYRTARAAIGFDMNADYEYALLRLLAGEGDFARVEPAEVREILRGELESPNPNVGIFREYANCDVWITAPPAWLSDVLAEPEMDLPRHAPATPAASEPEPEEFADAGTQSDSEEPAPTEAGPPPVRDGVVVGARPQECAFCGGLLPPGRLVNFCPYCGNDLSLRPCPACGEILEPRWRFCANCGTAVESYDAEAN